LAAAAVVFVVASAVVVSSPTGAVSPPAPTTSVIPTGASDNQLTGVSCPTVSRCVAVGQSAAMASVEQWNGTSWSTVVSPDVVGSRFAAVSCSSTTNCFAVGSQLRSGSTTTFIERWNGKTWSIVPSANPGGTTGAQLAGVSCTNTTFCVAVGTQFVTGSVGSKTLVERWNGHDWLISTSPNPAGARMVSLHAVSCTSTLDCAAVGSDTTPAGSLQTLIERWNAKTWSVVASPSQGVALGGELLGVSCSSAKNCVAVGEDHGYTQKGLAVAERWNGTTWSVVAPVSDNQSVNHLSGVSCTSTTDCVAVGYVQYYSPDPFGGLLTRVERWNGKKWSILASPSPGATQSTLAAVSCKTATNCVAVGLTTNSAFERSLSNLETLAEQWNGTSWSVVSTPDPISAPFAVFDGVSCTTTTNCIAVGNTLTVPGRNDTLIEGWNGTAWSIMTSPNPTGATISQLAGVSCTSATNCVAVGRYTTSTSPSAADTGPFETLVEQWNGTAWSIVPTPNPAGSTFARLDRVSCTSTTNCMAIGVAAPTSSGTDNPLAEQWNGTVWSIVTSAVDGPNPTGKTIGLSGLSCTSATHCLAVYSFTQGGWASWIFAEQWDGTTWSEEFPAVPQEVDETLSGVSCTSTTICMVTGAYTRAFAIGVAFTETLAEQVNGTGWSIVNSTNPGPAHPVLVAVSCTSAARCISVGASSTTMSSFDPPQTLAEQWNATRYLGTSWSVVATPNPSGAAASELVSVSCATPTSCIAVGDSQNASTGATTPLTELWNGTTWTIVPNVA